MKGRGLGLNGPGSPRGPGTHMHMGPFGPILGLWRRGGGGMSHTNAGTYGWVGVCHITNAVVMMGGGMPQPWGCQVSMVVICSWVGRNCPPQRPPFQLLGGLPIWEIYIYIYIYMKKLIS
jgi:hypothetical protein